MTWLWVRPCDQAATFGSSWVVMPVVVQRQVSGHGVRLSWSTSSCASPTGWCLSSVHRQSGGYCRYVAETGRPHPCHGAVADSCGPPAIVIPQLQYIDQVFDVLVAQFQQIRSKSWETVEIPQLQLEFSWQSCCSPVVCNNRCPWSSQFIDGCERPCDHA